MLGYTVFPLQYVLFFNLHYLSANGISNLGSDEFWTEELGIIFVMLVCVCGTDSACGSSIK